MVRYRVIASGRVQGVGFRYFVSMNASKLPLTGYVSNQYNGTVLMEIQGEKKDIDQILVLIKKGNYFLRVDNLDIKEIPLKEEKGFKIKY